MPLPSIGCPEWDYDHNPNSPLLLPGRCTLLLQQVRTDRDAANRFLADSRGAHGVLFEGLTPPGFPHYAGHYRGEPLPCLDVYRVGVSFDPAVGFEPSTTVAAMRLLVERIDTSRAAIQAARTVPGPRLPEAEVLKYSLALACAIHVEFLTIHPYANGNGHVARLLLICLLGVLGWWLRAWPFEDRPSDPPYSALLARHRRGDPVPLEAFVLSHL